MSNKLETYKVKEWTPLGRNTFQPPFKISDALINEARIVHVVKGNSKLFSANKILNLKANDTVVMKADNFVNNWFENIDNSNNQVIIFSLTSDYINKIYNNQLPEWLSSKKASFTNSVEKAEPTFILDSFYNGLKNYLDNPQHLTEDIIQVKTKELISILAQHDQAKLIRNLFGDLFNTPERNFQEAIQKNLFEDLSIDDLAFLTNLSLSSFKRKFSSIYGTSPNKYITSKRLEKAQTLLNTTDLSISEIAYDCGFSDVGYFSKTFKKHYNLSPSDIRKIPLD